MQIVAPQGGGDSAWLALRLALWPDVSEAEHLSGMVDALARGHYVRLAVTASGSAVGFVEASKRVDYVNGIRSSPVAFLEGLYVAPKSRREGIARALVETVVKWASTEGCLELASDSLVRKLNALFTSVEGCMMPNHRLERTRAAASVRLGECRCCG